MTPQQRKRARAQKQNQQQKTTNRIRRVHYVYATIINKGWSYKELVTGIVERLADKHLNFITTTKSTYYKDLKPWAAQELMERQVLGKKRIVDDDELISKTNVPKNFNQYRGGRGDYESENYN